MIDSGRGNTRAEDAQGTPTQSHVSPSILAYEDEMRHGKDLLPHRKDLCAEREDLAGAVEKEADRIPLQ